MLADYHAMDPKGEKKQKYNKQTSKLLILWQMHLGWDNPNFKKHYKGAYAKSKDLSEYPQDICTTIRLLDGAEDQQKKRDAS